MHESWIDIENLYELNYVLLLFFVIYLQSIERDKIFEYTRLYTLCHSDYSPVHEINGNIHAKQKDRHLNQQRDLQHRSFRSPNQRSDDVDNH